MEHNSHSSDDLTLDEDDSAADINVQNRELRVAYRACLLQVHEATGDGVAWESAHAQLMQTAEAFVQLNRPLVFSIVADAAGLHSRDLADHQQAAMLGLWEAFAGLEGSSGRGGQPGEEDAGWNPEKGTFSTWARRFVRGRVLRSLHAHDSSAVGLKYDTFTQRPRVLDAEESLSKELGRTPTDEEVATAASVTVATVRVAREPAPLSTDAEFEGEDGVYTLAQTMADRSADQARSLSDETFEAAEHELVRRIAASDVRGTDLLAFLMRSGLSGGSRRQITDISTMLNVDRGKVQRGVRRAEKKFGLPTGTFSGAHAGGQDATDSEPQS